MEGKPHTHARTHTIIHSHLYCCNTSHLDSCFMSLCVKHMDFHDACVFTQTDLLLEAGEQGLWDQVMWSQSPCRYLGGAGPRHRPRRPSPSAATINRGHHILKMIILAASYPRGCIVKMANRKKINQCWKKRHWQTHWLPHRAVFLVLVQKTNTDGSSNLPVFQTTSV